MCCFSQPVKSVSNTHLFARLSAAGKQMLVYQMLFESERPNAMILPLPVAAPAGEDAVRFISLKGYDRFFADLHRAFPVPPPLTLWPSRAVSASVDKQQLQVHDVGDFVASFVPTLDDFGRLDAQFVIPRASWSKIPQYDDYGFAVFQLKSLAGKPHPLAFEFSTRWNDRLFFPTVHIHDGQVHDKEEFDHTLFLQHPEFDAEVGQYQGPQAVDGSTGYVRSRSVAAKYCDVQAARGIIEPDLLLHRQRIQGILRNQDIIARPPALARGLGGSDTLARYILPAGAAAAALGGITWFVKRRDAVARLQAASRAARQHSVSEAAES